MKRRLILFMTLISLMSVGCTKQASSTGTPAETDTSTPIEASAESEDNTPSEVPAETSTQTTTEAQTAEKSTVASAETSGELYPTIESLVPEGWTIASDSTGEKAMGLGQLNSDELEDVALIVESSEAGEMGQPRMMIIAYGTEGGYALSVKAENVVMSSESGGVWGDPFESLSIDSDLREVTVNHYGGSNWRWYNAYTYREIDDQWYLVKAIEGNYFTGEWTKDNNEEISYDYEAGTFTKKVLDEDENEILTEGVLDGGDLTKIEAVQFQ